LVVAWVDRVTSSTDTPFIASETTKVEESETVERFGRVDEPVDDVIAGILGYRLVPKQQDDEQAKRSHRGQRGIPDRP
jgi:hypothetical protein